MKDDYPGHFYSSQLIRAPKPIFNHDFFAVEKILSSKKIKGEKFFFVKFLYYPSKFNQYISENNIKTSHAK
jgi:hypothetical protein